MTGIAIYIEGGGDSAATKAALRQGMDTFLTSLKEMAREKALHWKLVCCGGRNQTCDAFINEYRNGDSQLVVLVVDAEGPVTSSASAHLIAHDRWNLKGVANDHLHLMVQTMEAWIAADPDALSAYYGQSFHKKQLPATQDLESAAKADVANALYRATKDTQKGPYKKIRHASDLLRRIDSEKVRKRCRNCNRLFAILGAQITKL